MSEDGEILDTINPELTIYFKTPFNHDTTKEAELTADRDFDKSLTDQSFKEEADINTIIKRLKLGQHQGDVPLPEHFSSQPRMTYLEMQERLLETSATFYNLAPEIRNEFLNNPARWADQVMKDLAKGNVQNLQRMGIDVEVRPATATQEPPVPANKADGGEGGDPPPKAPQKTDSAK